MKKIASVLIAIMLSLPFLSSTVSAEEASAEVVKVERFDIVTDMEELKELSQQQKQQRMQQRSAPMKDEDSNVLWADQLVERRTYSDNSVQEDHAISVIASFDSTDTHLEAEVRDGYSVMQWVFVTEYDKVHRELSIRHVAASVSQNSTPLANLYQSIVISGALRGDVPAVSEQRFYNIVDFTAYVVQSPDTTPYRFNSFNDIYVDIKLEAVAKNGRRGVILSSINRGGDWVSQSNVYEW